MDIHQGILYSVYIHRGKLTERRVYDASYEECRHWVQQTYGSIPGLTLLPYIDNVGGCVFELDEWDLACGDDGVDPLVVMGVSVGECPEQPDEPAE